MALKGAFLMQIIYYCDNTARDKNIKYIHIVNMFYWNGCFRYDKSLKNPLMWKGIRIVYIPIRWN
ncbi:hypothetical protein FIY07_21755 [Salmonella enterica]|nr:hypothetical protein [Salmonella enterica]